MTLLGGDPGIGKSTLLLQLAGMLVEPSASKHFAQASQESQNGAEANGVESNGIVPGHSDDTDPDESDDESEMEDQPGVLYVSAEESAEQVRFRRLTIMHSEQSVTCKSQSRNFFMIGRGTSVTLSVVIIILLK